MRVHIQDRDTVAAAHPEWDTSNDVFMKDKSTIVGMALGASLAGANDDRQRRESKKATSEAKKLAAAEDYSRRLQAAAAGYTDEERKMGSFAKWFSRTIYIAGGLGIVYAITYVVVTGKFQ